jgi:hypothetical protein
LACSDEQLVRIAPSYNVINDQAVINEELASGDVKGLQEKIHQLKVGDIILFCDLCNMKKLDKTAVWILI